jgi:hypothetical protein
VEVAVEDLALKTDFQVNLFIKQPEVAVRQSVFKTQRKI